MPTFKPENIPTLVSQLCGNVQADPDPPKSGSKYRIYPIRCAEKKWAVRVPLHKAYLPKKYVSSQVEEEGSLLAQLKDCGFSLAPEVLKYDSSFNNLIGFPYIICRWVDGEPLKGLPADKKLRRHVLDQMADFILELASYSMDIPTDEAPFWAGTTNHLLTSIDDRIIRVIRGYETLMSLQDCFIQRALHRQTIHPDLDIPLPMIISHRNLSLENIIVDIKYNIKGQVVLPEPKRRLSYIRSHSLLKLRILHWDSAKRIPLQFALDFPRFLQIEPSPGELWTPKTSYPVSHAEVFLEPPLQLQIDRETFLSHISSSDKYEAIIPFATIPFTKGRISGERLSLRRVYTTVLRDPYVDWRRLNAKAAFDKATHMFLVKTSWFLGSKWSPLNFDLERVKAHLDVEVKDFLSGDIGREWSLRHGGLVSKNHLLKLIAKDEC